VADRWHLGKNLADSISTLLARCRADIRQTFQTSRDPATEPPQELRPYRSRRERQAHHARRLQRLDRYTQVVALHHQGLHAADIASRVGIGERSVRRWLAHGSFPEASYRRRRPSLIDAYEAYVKQRWREGCHNGLQLHRELTERGYKGSPKALYSYLATLRPPTSTATEPRGRKADISSAAPFESFSSHRGVWLFLRKPDDLEEVEQATLALIRQASPSAETAYRLAQAFMQMVRQRTGQQLDTWLAEVEGSHLPELVSFAAGIQHD
jgi:transposase